MKRQTLSISPNHPFVIPLGIGEIHQFERKDLKESLKSYIGSMNYQLQPIPFSNSTSISQKVIAIFSHPTIRSGPLINIIKARKELINQLDFFISQGKPIELTLLAVPFKTGNPLKVHHSNSDLGEIVFLLRLAEISRLIEKVYSPGARFTILSEGQCLSEIMGVTKAEAIKYRESNNIIVKKLGLQKYILIKDLFDDVVAKVNGFNRKMDVNTKALKQAFEKGDSEVQQQVVKTFPTIQTSLNRRNLAIKEACELYLNVPEDLKKEALEKTFVYLAFHKTRYDTRALEKAFPSALRATLTPRVGRLGIVPINKNTPLFPHHGVGVVRKDKTVTVMYEYDILRIGNFREVFFNGKLLCFEEV